ncbi:DDE Tnp4 domain-containing protein [Trichonephila clavipes]|nr:DDE Tnp4 domain-containing protein [Trichonephila clavipes]
MSEELVVSGVLVLSKVIKKELIRRQNAKRKKRKVWVKPWVGRRTEYGASHTLLKELKNEDHTANRNMLRITVTTKLEITLRYLATGDSFKSLEYLFRVPETTISRFLPHVLKEICCVLRPFINVPTTVEEWKKLKRFSSNVGISLDAVERLMVNMFLLKDLLVQVQYTTTIRKPTASYYLLWWMLIIASLTLINWVSCEDHVIIGDDAFPLRPDLMKPFSKHGLSDEEKIFNYRTSRARRVSENAFGILAWRFRVFSKAIELKPDTIDRVILAACSLNNWLRKTSPGHYICHKMHWTEKILTQEK